MVLNSYLMIPPMKEETRKLHHDRHTVSLLTDHMVFAPKYRGKILTGDVAMITEGILCKTCIELDIEERIPPYKRPGYTPCKKRYVHASFLSTGYVTECDMDGYVQP